MMDYIKVYNEYLINNHIDIGLVDYFKNIHYKYYKKVDISFIDYS